MDWAEGNRAGVEAARRAIGQARETEDMPRLVAAIRDTVQAEGDAWATGFLYEVAARAIGKTIEGRER